MGALESKEPDKDGGLLNEKTRSRRAAVLDSATNQGDLATGLSNRAQRICGGDCHACEFVCTHHNHSSLSGPSNVL